MLGSNGDLDINSFKKLIPIDKIMSKEHRGGHLMSGLMSTFADKTTDRRFSGPLTPKREVPTN